MASKIDALAYIVVQSTDLAKWSEYGEQMLGMSSAETDAGLFLKMDDRDYRIAIVPGPEDRYLASGWQVADAAALAAVRSSIESAGLSCNNGDAATKAARKVTDLFSFTDPAGNLHEVSTGYIGDAQAFVSPIGVEGFVTGDMGLGHTVLPALPFDETLKFFTETLGFGISDEFDFQPGPDAPVIRIRFLHAGNPRHHSLALAEMPNPAGCVHAMVEVTSMTDVGKAHDRLQQKGVKLMATLGQHCNDHMTSFYMLTPGNFALEFGWGGITVDVDNHETTHSEAISFWGHDFSVGFQ
jgi:3,4-dihydroxy-9,10-secoandrosta-1,3,5(10)-triene-9,17-dione 4,5-dioxygenase